VTRICIRVAGVRSLNTRAARILKRNDQEARKYRSCGDDQALSFLTLWALEIARFISREYYLSALVSLLSVRRGLTPSDRVSTLFFFSLDKYFFQIGLMKIHMMIEIRNASFGASRVEAC